MHMIAIVFILPPGLDYYDLRRRTHPGFRVDTSFYYTGECIIDKYQVDALDSNSDLDRKKCVI
jgi:hypothetical protein